MLNEIQAVQNPALGAALIWQFSIGYAPNKSALDGVPIPLAFIVLPLVLHAETRENINSTRAGLHKFEDKYRDKYDLLFAIQDRAIAMRDLSKRSLATGIASGLLTLVPQDGVIWPTHISIPKNISSSVGDLFKAAEKVGIWSRQVSLFELSKTLHVDF